MQVEGSDQWGNITTGIDLIRKKLDKTAYGFTMPLILDKYGNKFGKSEGNALWLDKDKTSSYELYQYLINVDDSMVIHYLKVFTFLSKTEIEELEEKNRNHPELREAHKALAREIITDLHGKEEFEEAVKISEALFCENVKNLTSNQIEIGFKGVPTFELNEDKKLIDVLVDFSITSSRREARELLNNDAISINGESVSDENKLINSDIAIDNQFIVIRRGKKKYYLIKVK